MSTTRVSDDARAAIKEEAERRDTSMGEVVDDLVAANLDLDGDGDMEDSTESEVSEDGESDEETANNGDNDVIGYCPVCGFEFVEEDRNSHLIAADSVECPVPSCREYNRKQPVRELFDEPPGHIENPPTVSDSEDMQDEEA